MKRELETLFVICAALTVKKKIRLLIKLCVCVFLQASFGVLRTGVCGRYGDERLRWSTVCLPTSGTRHSGYRFAHYLHLSGAPTGFGRYVRLSRMAASSLAQPVRR